MILTIPGDVEFDEIFKVLNVWRQSLDFIVAQSQLAEAVEPEKVLQKTIVTNET